MTKPAKPIELYIFRICPNSRGVMLVMKALDIPFNKHILDHKSSSHAGEPCDFNKINPLHTVPTIDDNGFKLWEGRAIMYYLIDKYGGDQCKIFPHDPEKRAIVNRMMWFDGQGLFPHIQAYVLPQWVMEKPQAVVADKEAPMKGSLKQLDTFLSKTAYVAGDTLSVADFPILISIYQLELINYDISGYPHIVAWKSKLQKELPYLSEMNEGLEFWKANRKGGIKQ